MRALPPGTEPLLALSAVLRSIESVRNGSALYLLMVTFAASGMALALARGALAEGAAQIAMAWGAAALITVFYGGSAAGLLLMDEACGRPGRDPAEALRQSLAIGHRLLLVALAAAAVAALVVALAFALLWASRLPAVGPPLLGVVVAVMVPVLGLVALALLMLVGPIAAPAVWFGLSVRQALAMIAHQTRRRMVHAVMLSTAVSLLTAAVAALVSFVVLAGGRAVLALAAFAPGLELLPQPFLAALFGIGYHAPSGAGALPAHTAAALTGAGVVFAIGLVVPGAVYLRGVCELFLALRGEDSRPLAADTGDAATNDTP